MGSGTRSLLCSYKTHISQPTKHSSEPACIFFLRRDGLVCACVCSSVSSFCFGGEGIFVAFGSKTTFLSGKKLFVRLFLSLAYQSIPRWDKLRERKLHSLHSHFFCAILGMIWLCRQNLLQDSLIWGFLVTLGRRRDHPRIRGSGWGWR